MLYIVALRSDDAGIKSEAARYLDSISESCRNEFDGIWFVNSEKSAVEIRDHLRRLLEPAGKVTVALLAGSAAWHGVDADCENWLLQHL